MRMTSHRRKNEEAPTEIDAHLRPGVAASAGSDETAIDRADPRSSRTIHFGDVLDGRYRIEEPLGRTPVGYLFRGQMLSLRTRVTIHVLDRTLTARPLVCERIRREAAAYAGVQHSRLGRIIDFVAGEPTFLVIEHLGGRSLAQLLADEGPLAWSRAARIVVDVASAVAALHASGVAHGHIEPANIVLTDDGERRDDVRLIGLATGSWPATRSDAWKDIVAWHDLGVGDHEEAVAEDLRRLGGLLHELVHGARPRRPDPGDGAGALPDELCTTVERADGTAQACHFASARELADALRQLLQPRTDLPAPPRGPRIGAWVAVATLLAFIAATLAFWYARMTAPPLVRP